MSLASTNQIRRIVDYRREVGVIAWLFGTTRTGLRNMPKGRTSGEGRISELFGKMPHRCWTAESLQIDPRDVHQCGQETFCVLLPLLVM